MSGEQGPAQMTLGVHIRPETSIGVEVYEATGVRGAFVTVAIGELPAEVSLFLRNEDEANRLVQAVGEARARLVGAQTRAKRAEQPEQPELPVVAAS